MAKVRKTDPCPCGSGKKYKYCHGAPPEPAEKSGPPQRQVFLWLIVGLAPLAYLFSLYQSDPQATVNRVWSAEHGHYHTRDGAEIPAEEPAPADAADPATATADPATATADPTVAPGPPPPGKIWSPEHGHWHNTEGGPQNVEPDAWEVGADAEHFKETYELEPPEGDPPPGKTWSASHGHWHDASQ